MDNETWTIDGDTIKGPQADMYPLLFERVHATDADMALAAAAPRLRAALQSILENCALIHKHWGEGGNGKQADLAEATARALLAELDKPT